MTLKLLGAFIIVIGCGGCGFAIALSHKRETCALQQLISALEFMRCEMQYRLTPLPELCKLTALTHNGPIKTYFDNLSKELEQQISPNVQLCAEATLARCKTMPAITAEALQDLFKSLGNFDLDGQLQGLSSARDLTEAKLKKHAENQDARIRSYQTLGICAGAALAILFI